MLLEEAFKQIDLQICRYIHRCTDINGYIRIYVFDRQIHMPCKIFILDRFLSFYYLSIFVPTNLYLFLYHLNLYLLLHISIYPYIIFQARRSETARNLLLRRVGEVTRLNKKLMFKVIFLFISLQEGHVRGNTSFYKPKRRPCSR